MGPPSFSCCLGALACLFVLVSRAAVDLVPCDRTRRVLTAPSGIIADSPLGLNYTQDSHCEWLIRANGSQQFITLSFRSMGTECSYDYVFVYDGDSYRSPLLGSFSGKTEPQRVVATSGFMLILLYSDTNYVLDGFRAEFSVTDCPNNCSAHGMCYENRCICSTDWGGSDCSRRLCAEDCGLKEGRGRCERGQCICFAGYSGQSCTLFDHDPQGNRWHWLSHSEGGLTPRAAHTAVYIPTSDSLYVFGGYDLNNILAHLEVYSFGNSTWRDENGQVLPYSPLVTSVDPASLGHLINQASAAWQHEWGLNPRTSFLRNLLLSVSDNATFSRRRQRHSHAPDGEKPAPRYGHAACEVTGGFVIYGGKLDNGSLANDLWLYNVLSAKWELRAHSSDFQPPALTRHTLTAVADTIYLFGGSEADGEFSSKLYRIQLQGDEQEAWHEVDVRGGKELDVRVVAHSTVYHPATNSLLVYGGIVAGVARFSKLSDRMFAFQLDARHWTEIHYTREHLRERFVPRERAFHSANILGNYLVIFGGYSHRHNKEEICYDNQMYLYHLGCHTWVNPDILGKASESRYPKQQGVFAHAAAVRGGNTLLLVGGYHGNVNGDLLAYTVPPMVAARRGERYEPEGACPRHRNYGECSADPECGWCSADEMCYGRTIGANCTTNLQTTRCAGICPALGDCHACLIHGHDAQGSGAQPLAVSAAYKLGLGKCTWCVQNARCHHSDDNYGVCGLWEDSPSLIPGWWGAKGTEVTRAEECRELDRRPGLTFLKYYHPVNFSQPDHVAIINATTVDFNAPQTYQRVDPNVGGEMVARLLGFLRPPDDFKEMLKVCVSYSAANLKIEESMLLNISADQKNCQPSIPWPTTDDTARVSIDFESRKAISLGAYNWHQTSRMELLHYHDKETPKVFTFEYLEPYANGSCAKYHNCLHCLTDSDCGWCATTNTCVPRSDDETLTCLSAAGNWRYLTLQPAACSNCTNFISCESCIGSGLCEWSIEEAQCARKSTGLNVATRVSQCPAPCYKRPDCTACLEEKGRCVWCETTQQCFSFSVYTSEYQFGLCREWLDQAFPLLANDDTLLKPAQKPHTQCKSCALHANCSSCLSALSCGWCFNASNPITGVCVQGDFNQPRSDCADALNTPNARWAYAHCPDVDECGLGLHDCHPQAICTNTDGSFSCHCKRGYLGDGKTSCVRTCYNVCVHGTCQGEPDYVCKCDLGWTGADCSVNCGCNNHSDCPQGVGVCEECRDWTTGAHCEQCRAGGYGNATTAEGCRQCACNGHGIREVGECDARTGVCHCTDNTMGDHCEKCAANYYGNPRHGGQCYYQCEARGVLKSGGRQGITSRQTYVSPWGGAPTRECLWIISPEVVEEGGVIIQLQVNASQLNITCGENAVYVYDGLPELVEMGSQSALSAVFCSEEALPSAVVESRTGYLTVHYKQGLAHEGFSAAYDVLVCDNCTAPRRCKNGQCVCEEGLVGPYCNELICPEDCNAATSQGSCDRSYGRCLCTSGWGGPSCSIRLTGKQLVFAELFNTLHLADNLEHLRKTLPRFGHSLAADRRGSLWMFGGYSLSHGPLNDIRLFDTRNSSWMQVTVDSTPDAKMPQGRYFHSTDIMHSKQAIFVYGGLTKAGRTGANRTLDDFWQFDIQNQRWNEIESDGSRWPPAVAGHTLTSYRNASIESLILIGGVSPQNGFFNEVWEYRVDKGVWFSWHTKGAGPLGLFGHTTVFHAHSNSFYIFGGYEYMEQRSVLSNKLYRLGYDTRTWTEMNIFSSTLGVPRARYFHTAVTTDTHMFILGGRIWPWNVTDTLYAYSYNCNQWINLIAEGIEKVGPLPGQAFTQAMTIDPDGDAAYVVGGWGNDAHCSVLKIALPAEFCSLWTTRHTCLQVPGCGHCSLSKSHERYEESCYTNTKAQCPITVSIIGVEVEDNRGKVCEGSVLTSDCMSLHDCTNCVQIYGCQWCDGMCTMNRTCKGEVAASLSQCKYTPCLATDCIQCHQIPRCEWSYSKQKCIPIVRDQEANAIDVCPPSCNLHTSCTACLNVADCRWSTQLDECISAAYQPMYCAGGVCGLVLQTDDRQYCPEPCSSFKQCSTCLRSAYCGWCAVPGISGRGVCTDGSSEKPMLGSCTDVYQEYVLDDEEEVDVNETYTWHYVKCPPEDECANGHHNCEEESQMCEDREDGYECVCGRGYKTGLNGCEPVCEQGCVRGQCVQPNKCQCDFGYVGANCSIQCQCNGHANCEGPDKLDKCLTCHNDTMGAQCEKCQPLFVGDPTNGAICTPCVEYCNGHTTICIDNATDPLLPDDIDLIEIRKYLKEGPKLSAQCLRCANLTTGDRCHECISGNFRGSEDHHDACRPCNCHGHGDTCDPVTGEKCNCKNNTESDACPLGSAGKNAAFPCWIFQCSKCKDGYVGTPKAGHQCYKQMTVESKMCFDAKPIDECKMKPKPLNPGETVFFYIQPRFMNVDIRIMIDVTQGRLNVYLSTHDDTYVVWPNASTGMQEIQLDAQYGAWENGTQKTEDVLVHREAFGLRTYITVEKPKTVLAVRGVKDRLVITLPEEYHRLDSTRFYLILQAVDVPESEKVAYGIVFMRQDQLHIDLFVFFSVFFSCFFLFLAACVVAWKAKQAADVRRARRRHVVEMLHMAKRPFATVTVSVTAKPRPKKSGSYDLRPVAIEPTENGIAAVATVFVSLPGAHCAPVKLALASSLILLTRQFPTGGRTFLRRRSTHAAPPT